MMKQYILHILSKAIHSFPAFVAILMVTTSCSEEPDCSMTARPIMNAGLYTFDRANGTTHPDTLDILTITALGTDSVILNNEENVTGLTLPLRYSADSTVLVFHYSFMRRDTVVIRHTNTPYFLSMDCGYQMQQSLTDTRHTNHVLDSISITQTEVSIYGTENIRLFY